ncbi:hypothetical protein ACMXYX_08490 [Neptuniibacter sp. QD72_48]|uniref:hypothetical protein n=1 Tax=unclassified Neptuniibacter TaxID=2630693 RepID=UPI0039F5686E
MTTVNDALIALTVEAIEETYILLQLETNDELKPALYDQYQSLKDKRDELFDAEALEASEQLMAAIVALAEHTKSAREATDAVNKDIDRINKITNKINKGVKVLEKLVNVLT